MEELSRLFSLEGQTAALTGAASGIGRSTAVTLAKAGARVVLGDINEAGLEETKRIIEDTGGTAVSVRCDVSKQQDVAALVQRAIDDFGRLDVMGNIAGFPHESLVVDTREEDLDRVMNVMMKGVFFGCQEAMKVMQPRRSGNIVNISSGAIDGGSPGWACYAMAKASVAMLTKVLAKEAGPYGIRVNAIAPGMIVTNFTARHWTGEDGVADVEKKEAYLEGVRQGTPLGFEGRPEDVAHAILYLVSEAGSFMTGQTLRPNGGTSTLW